MRERRPHSWFRKIMDIDEHEIKQACLIPYPTISYSTPIWITSMETHIGRDYNSTIRLNHRTVSRKHAVIKAENGGYRVIDTESRNGTYINNQRIKQSVLRHGDNICFGIRSFQFFINSNQLPVM